MTKQQILDKISAVKASIASYTAAKSSYEREIAVSNASLSACKLKTCRTNRQKEIDQWQALINAEVAKIASANDELKSLNASLAAANESEVKLADKGISSSALELKATGEAQAAVKSAEITAQAQAAAITADSGASSNRKTAITAGIVIGVLVVAVIVGLTVAKKMKKKKGAKK